LGWIGLGWVETDTEESLRRRGEDEEDEKTRGRRTAYDEHNEENDDDHDTDGYDDESDSDDNDDGRKRLTAAFFSHQLHCCQLRKVNLKHLSETS